MEMYTRIVAISLLSNEIEIGGPLFSKIHQKALGVVLIASNPKPDSTLTLKTFWDRQLCFYVKKLFVSKKTQKSELCHFSWEIYVIKFSALRTRSYVRGEKFDDINLLWKMTKFTFLCFFTNKYFFYIKAKLTVSKSF